MACQTHGNRGEEAVPADHSGISVVEVAAEVAEAGATALARCVDTVTEVLLEHFGEEAFPFHDDELAYGTGIERVEAVGLAKKICSALDEVDRTRETQSR